MKVQTWLKNKINTPNMLPFRTRLSRNDYVANLRDAYTSKEYVFVERTLVTLERVNNDWKETIKKPSVSLVEISELSKHIDKVRGALHEVAKIRLLPKHVIMVREVKDDLLFLSAIYSALTWYRK